MESKEGSFGLSSSIRDDWTIKKIKGTSSFFSERRVLFHSGVCPTASPQRTETARVRQTVVNQAPPSKLSGQILVSFGALWRCNSTVWPPGELRLQFELLRSGIDPSLIS